MKPYITNKVKRGKSENTLILLYANFLCVGYNFLIFKKGDGGGGLEWKIASVFVLLPWYSDFQYQVCNVGGNGGRGQPPAFPHVCLRNSTRSGVYPPPHQHIPNLYLMYTVKCKKCLTKQNKKHFEIKNISTFLPKFRNHSSLGKVRRKLGKVGFVRSEDNN